MHRKPIIAIFVKENKPVAAYTLLYMKITLIQTDIVWGDVQANLASFTQQMLQAEKSDVYVLPEMFSTGFATDPEGTAETEPAESLAWMHRMADELDAAVAGSIALKLTDGSFRNRFYFVKPHEAEVFSDKRHLFSYGHENEHYTPGNERVVVEFRGARFLLLVCYDLRFPVWSRNHGDYDCILYVASWPTSRIEVWNTLLKARAIENQCYVAGVNRIGEDPACSYSGGTMLIDAYGRIQCQCEMNTSCSVTATLDLEKLAAFRVKFPVLNDRD